MEPEKPRLHYDESRNPTLVGIWGVDINMGTDPHTVERVYGAGGDRVGIRDLDEIEFGNRSDGTTYMTADQTRERYNLELV